MRSCSSPPDARSFSSRTRSRLEARMSIRVPAIMIQGTGSNVGKSLLVAGLCRAFARRGLRVRPFKPQNMSNNAAARRRAARSGARRRCRRAPPGRAERPHEPGPAEARNRHGVRRSSFRENASGSSSRRLIERRGALLPFVLDSFRQVWQGCRSDRRRGRRQPGRNQSAQGDIANMGFAKAADVPVILAGDIDRGGVIASIVGTHAVLDDEDRARVRGFIINKFRGDTRSVRRRHRDDRDADRLAVARCRALVCRGSRAAGGRRARHRVGEPRAAPPSRSRCRCCRASQISTISIR